MGYGEGYAEYALAYLEYVVPSPDGVSFAQGARGYGFDRDGLSRCSGWGMRNYFYDYCCCWLRRFGNEWCYNRCKEPRCMELISKRCGATACVTSLGAYSNVKFDAIIDFTGVGSTTAEAIAAVRWIL
jgi:hypothetical protein